MKELQSYVGQWQQSTFGPGDRSLSCSKHLRKEADELVHELELKFLNQNKDNPKRLSNISNELADILILAIGCAYRLGIDLEDAVLNKMIVNEKREWKSENEDGIIEHVQKEQVEDWTF